MKRKFLLIYSWLVRTLLLFLPDIPFIMRFRGLLYGIGMNKCGKDFQVASDVIIRGLEEFEIGEHIFIGNGTILICGCRLYIGDKVLIGPKNVVVTSNHTFSYDSFRYGNPKEVPIIVHKGVWITSNCTIIGGAEILECCIVAPNTTYGRINQQYNNSLYSGENRAHYIKSINNN